MTAKHLLFTSKIIGCLLITVAFSSCKKDKTVPPQTQVSPVTLGLYEYASGVNKRIFLPITLVGTKAVTYYTVFDTGSSGMTLDAAGILPASMITSSGIQFTGDSVVVNGITVTNTKGTISFGDQLSSTKEYGNLAYANITIGDAQGNLTLKRVPFFLYYKIVDETGAQLSAHASDVFGVGPGTSYITSLIQSPLRSFSAGTGLTSGFKLATLNKSLFSTSGTYVSNLLTIGLSNSDLSSSGFIMHPLSYSNSGGYSPNIPATITYNGKTISGQILFDTGTPSTTVIEDRLATNSVGSLPANSTVTVTTNKGFVYTYTTSSTGNLTEVQNPNNTGDYRTIFSLDFFISNEYLTDYGNHQIGLKNN
ncbi:hypothetical protein J3L18_09815 [Mucilaginibacter gossypii]|uniref:hypothetical protein n=1 Tax=Mucilaginibacter gossypii TaxID=551996 RepID=UPI000DCE1BE9|nr:MULTISPECIES: hypothetical protein [Mucilaginibacter]QTE39326.1 hypothetical protein J3L18_09815 [Mucilaginibacter gossypii]RAV51272.1 hypothetical protein DIU36_25725 [Mucilaginibacter rubeus]